MTEPDVLTEVPETLKRIVRYITRGFYDIEAALIIDLLIHHPCIKEDDLIDLLKFERKQLRQAMTILKNDKFINVRMRAETDAEGKMTRHNYYFINYSVLVNVVKFKLDHMRKKIEMEERDSTSRASFLCPRCEKTFTDLEADQLFDFTTLMFRCTYCQEEVKEETISLPKTDARTLMVKFNEQLQPIFSLLLEVEDIKLSAEILNPEPVDLSSKTRYIRMSFVHDVLFAHNMLHPILTPRQCYYKTFFNKMVIQDKNPRWQVMKWARKPLAHRESTHFSSMCNPPS